MVEEHGGEGHVPRQHSSRKVCFGDDGNETVPRIDLEPVLVYCCDGQTDR